MTSTATIPSNCPTCKWFKDGSAGKPFERRYLHPYGSTGTTLASIWMRAALRAPRPAPKSSKRKPEKDVTPKEFMRRLTYCSARKLSVPPVSATWFSGADQLSKYSSLSLCCSGTGDLNISEHFWHSRIPVVRQANCELPEQNGQWVGLSSSEMFKSATFTFVLGPR